LRKTAYIYYIEAMATELTFNFIFGRVIERIRNSTEAPNKNNAL